MKKLIMTLLCATAASVTACAAPPTAKMTLHIRDAETEKPLDKVEVKAQFRPDENKRLIAETKQTDTNGVCIVEGPIDYVSIACEVIMRGYYKPQVQLNFTGRNRLLNRWEPWNPTIGVKLRKKKNPVPMIAKWVESLDIPVWGKPIGFDLEKTDWIVPYGKGKQSDFFVNMYRRFENSSDYDAVAEITFPNDGDGIQLYAVSEEFQGSSFQFPYEVPMDGYKNAYVLERHATLQATKCSFNPEKDMYIFRVRTKKDEKGNVASACYGRIDRRIEIGWGDVLDFEYHFNPVPNERSLEYSGENLLKK